MIPGQADDTIFRPTFEVVTIAHDPNTRAESPRERAGGFAITPREHDVLVLVADGHTNKEIGVRLSITEGTVKKHVQSIIWKLRAADRTQAAILAYRLGLIEIDD
jgi:DNA-binding NarL/FixJ family response regulator